MKFAHKFAAGAQTLVAMCGVSILVMACGGGGGGGSSAAASLTSFTVTPMKGQFCTGAQVTAYDTSNTPIGSGSVNASGVASLSVPSSAVAPFHVTVGAGANGSCYWDEALGAYVSIPAQTVTLNALIPNLETAAASGVGVTFFTELAYQRATSGVSVVSITASEVQAANTAVAELFGLGAKGVSDVLTPPTLIGQNTPKISSSTTSWDIYAVAVAAMARLSANSTPNTPPVQVAAQWLSRANANPASGVGDLPEVQGWNAQWIAATTGASSVLAPGVAAPTPPVLSSYSLSGPVVSFNSVNSFTATHGLYADFMVTGWVGTTSTPASGSGTLTIGASVPTTLAGATVLQQTQITTGSVLVNGQNVDLSGNGTMFINPTTYAEKVENSPRHYAVYPVFTYPVSMRAGDSGILATATEYSDSSMSTMLGTTKHSYRVVSDSVSSLLLTLISDDYDTGNKHISQEQDTYRVATDGSVTPVSSRLVTYAVAGSVPSDLTMNYSSSSMPMGGPVISFNSLNSYLANQGFSGNFTFSGWTSNFFNGSTGVSSGSIAGSGTITLGAATPDMRDGVAVLHQVQTTIGNYTTHPAYYSPNGAPYTGPVSFGGSSNRYLDPVTYAEKEVSLVWREGWAVYPTFVYPGSIRAGDTVILVAGILYSDSFKTSVIGTVTKSYRVAPDSASSLLLTFITDTYDVNNAHAGQTQDIYRVNTNGTLVFVSSRELSYSSTGEVTSDNTQTMQ